MIDTDTTKAEIKQQVKDKREEIEELQDVALSQNKPELIEDVEAALHRHAEAQRGSINEDGVMEAQTLEGAEESSEDAQEEPESKKGSASAAPASGPNGRFRDTRPRQV